MPPKVLNRLPLSKTKKLQLKLSLQNQQLSNLIIDDTDDTDGPEDLDLHRSFSRPKVYEVDEKVMDLDMPLSDYVTVRLAVARAKAMQKYREIYKEA